MGNLENTANEYPRLVTERVLLAECPCCFAYLVDVVAASFRLFKSINPILI